MYLQNEPVGNFFSDVVAIDAWFVAAGDTPFHQLHVDVVFGEARVGGEGESPVRFRLAMKRAELVVILDEKEPADIVKSSVSRDERSLTAKKTSERTTSSNVSAGASGSVGINSEKLSTQIGISAKTDAKFESSDHVTTSEDLPYISARQAMTSDGNYKWEFRPTIEKLLLGRPWIAKESPRLSVLDKRKPGKKRLPVAVSIEIRCLREDIEITDIELKDEVAWRSFLASPFQKNKLLAAEAYIRTRLAKQGIFVQGKLDKFSTVTMGVKVVEIQ